MSKRVFKPFSRSGLRSGEGVDGLSKKGVIDAVANGRLELRLSADLGQQGHLGVRQGRIHTVSPIRPLHPLRKQRRSESRVHRTR